VVDDAYCGDGRPGFVNDGGVNPGLIILGGSGNTHDVVRAGIPAVVIPVHSDQFFYGWRIAALGIGATFPYRRITPDRLYQALARALTPQARQRAEEIGRTAAAENGVLAAVDAVEKLATATTRP
ncbi:nucleotide disphospho-sugar-binding domain-containing protein, partial [Nocardia abscessus]|uniref:nucleotide disphospho-sugar-binding domain-containing protein n=1 Tax=Nocardia abscessus TaxID=120957 RepID=UPI00313DB6B9